MRGTKIIKEGNAEIWREINVRGKIFSLKRGAAVFGIVFARDFPGFQPFPLCLSARARKFFHWACVRFRRDKRRDRLAQLRKSPPRISRNAPTRRDEFGRQRGRLDRVCGVLFYAGR